MFEDIDHITVLGSSALALICGLPVMALVFAFVIPDSPEWVFSSTLIVYVGLGMGSWVVYAEWLLKSG